MAEFYGTNFAGLTATPVQRVDGGDYGGIMRAHYDAYTTTGAETAGSTLFVGRLEPGERFLGGTVHWEALGAGVTLTLGDAGDPDRFLTAANAAAAGSAALSAFTGIGVRNAGTDAILLFLTVGGATAAADKGIRVEFRTVQK